VITDDRPSIPNRHRQNKHNAVVHERRVNWAGWKFVTCPAGSKGDALRTVARGGDPPACSAPSSPGPFSRLRREGEQLTGSEYATGWGFRRTLDPMRLALFPLKRRT
jgi:hypothetical protein